MVQDLCFRTMHAWSTARWRGCRQGMHGCVKGFGVVFAADGAPGERGAVSGVCLAVAREWRVCSCSRDTGLPWHSRALVHCWYFGLRKRRVLCGCTSLRHAVAWIRSRGHRCRDHMFGGIHHLSVKWETETRMRRMLWVCECAHETQVPLATRCVCAILQVGGKRFRWLGRRYVEAAVRCDGWGRWGPDLYGPPDAGAAVHELGVLVCEERLPAEGANRREAGEGFAKVGEDRRERDAVEALELAGRGEVVALDAAVDEEQRRKRDEDGAAGDGGDDKRAHEHADEAGGEGGDGALEGDVRGLDVLGEAVHEPPRRLSVEERHRQPEHLVEEAVVQHLRTRDGGVSVPQRGCLCTLRIAVPDASPTSRCMGGSTSGTANGRALRNSLRCAWAVQLGRLSWTEA